MYRELSERPPPQPSPGVPGEGNQSITSRTPTLFFVGCLLVAFGFLGCTPGIFHGPTAAARYVAIWVAIRAGVLLLVAAPLAALFDVSLGGWSDAAVRLACIAAAPLAVAALILAGAVALRIETGPGLVDLLSGDVMGAVISAVIVLLTDFVLFYNLFSMEGDEQTWYFILIVWAAQFFLAGLIGHAILHPWAPVHPYVPERNATHFYMN